MSHLTLGNVIAEHRKKLNLSQKELAAEIRNDDGEPISPQYLNDIERDRRAPKADSLLKQFAKILKLDAEYLLYLNGLFPEKERNHKLSEDQFKKAMVAFRKNQ